MAYVIPLKIPLQDCRCYDLMALYKSVNNNNYYYYK